MKSSAPSETKIVLGGIPTTVLTRANLASIMIADCKKARTIGKAWRPRLVFSSNGQSIVLAASDPRFYAAMARADIVHADGQPMVFASRILASKPLPERIATTDFIMDACVAAERDGLRFYLLGGTQENNARAVATFRQRFPKLLIVGHRHGFFSEGEAQEVIADINAAQPDVLWLGLGRPRQEYIAIRFQSALAGVAWIKTCGGMFNFYSGNYTRAPMWMQNLGLEWLYRSWREPRRLGKRYATTNLSAAWLLLTRTA